MLTLERPVEIKVLGQALGEIDTEGVQASYQQFWKMLEPVGLVGLAKWMSNAAELCPEDLIALFMLGLTGGITERTWQGDWKAATGMLAFPACLAPDFYRDIDDTETGPELPKTTELGSVVTEDDLKEPVKGLLYYGFSSSIQIVVADRLSVNEQLQVIKFLEDAYLDYPNLPVKNGLIFKRLSGGKIEVEEKPLRDKPI